MTARALSAEFCEALVLACAAGAPASAGQMVRDSAAAARIAATALSGHAGPGDGRALLAADLDLAKAFQLIAGWDRGSVTVILAEAVALGANRRAGGGWDGTGPTPEFVAACCRAGGTLADRTEAECMSLARFGRRLAEAGGEAASALLPALPASPGARLAALLRAWGMLAEGP